MIGFTARCCSAAPAAGDAPLRLDEHELDHAAWFSADALPELPPPFSLSRQIIDAWTAGRRRAPGAPVVAASE
jgi:NADH pyrophosphatase NudC (nudix superfamily)